MLAALNGIAQSDLSAPPVSAVPLRIVEYRRLKDTGPPFTSLSRRLVRHRPSDVERFAAERRRCSASDPGGAG